MSERAVREARDEDREELVHLVSQFFEEEGIDVAVKQITRNLMVMLADERATFLVCEGEGQIFGFVTATATHGLEYGWAAEIEDLYIRPEMRGRGISYILLAAAEDWCRDRGIADIQVVLTATGRKEQGLERFYQRHGYRNEGRLLMVKAL
ncbi:GNAT family N-acetyltransferase [Aestuariispira insulae]|uniref:GNAT family acetyltransferase n=1 Tax=Aestuariispira insulae TaxID=1461337 RepID=A0A3D9HVR3_9PROT|nr:GNAT family N-acetyltransferase [Aestuariispira insulae]RED53509.1 GNAT family acetyltransferase [Aestuariispira insulae]